MAEKTPVRVNFDGSGNPTGFAELQSSEYVGLDDGGTGGSYASLSALLEGLGLGTSDAPTFAGLQTSGNLVVGGNLQVDGTTTTVNSTTVTVDDPIFTLGGDTAPASDDNKDRGIEFRYHNGTTAKLGFFGFDDSTGKFVFIPDATNAAEVFSGTAGTIVANLEGNVTGTVSSLSGLTTDDLTEGSSNFYYTDEKVDDRVNALIIGGAGVDTAYDDAAGTLTLTADLSEVTADLNERIDDQVAALLIDSNTSGIDISYDDANGQLTISSDLSEVVEALQDNVQGLFVGGTGVTSAYDDASNALTLSIDFSEFDSDNIVEGSTNLFVTNERIDDRVNALLTDATTSGIDISYDDSGNALTLSVDLSEIVESLQDNVQGLFSGGTGITTTYDDASNTLSLSIDFSEFDTDNLTEGSTNLFFTDERAQDAVGGMLTGNTETLITATYDDTNAKINLVVDNDLANYDNSNSGFITATLTQEQVEDFVGGMLDGTETLISVSYDDTDGNIDFVVDNDLANYSNTNSAFITLSSLSAGTGISYNSGTGAISSTITQYTDSDAQAVSINNVVEDTTPQLGGNLDINSSNITGTGNIDTSGDITITSTSDTSAAGPIINLVRDSASPADADYLGQIKFKGDDDGGASTVYAKITGKIDDASAGTEDGLIEFATIKNGSSNIAARLKTTNFQLLNGTGLEVAGNATITGDLTVNGTTTTIDTTNTVVSDSLIELANGTSGSPANDAGLVIERGSSDNAFIGYDESEDKFKIGTGTFTGASTGNLTIATGTLLANLEGNVTGDVTGNVSGTSGSTTGNAATATQLATGRTIGMTGDVVWTSASFDGTGNVTGTSTIQANAVQIGNIDFLVDEDNMSSDSDVKVPTQQSVKAYVDSQITAEDLDFQADSGGALAIDLDSETLTFTGGTGIDTSGSGNTVTFAIDSTVVTESSTDTLTNKTINFENNTAIVEYAVTVSGGKFVIDGESQATISFNPGIVYRFDLSDSSVGSHPFKLSTTSDGSHNSGSEYTTGKTTNGSQGSSGAYVEYTVNAATPDILYYYCSSHSGMGGTITVFGSSYGDADVQSYLSAGTGITLSGSGVIASSITQYADSDVQSYLSGGTGVTMSGSGEFSIGQAVATTSNVTFADIAATGNVTITGNLDVNGTTTTIDTTNTTVTDLLIELGNGTSGSPSNDAGIVIERGSADNAFIGFDESADKFIVGTGSFTGASTGNLTISTGTLLANVEGNLTGTASNATTAAGIDATAVTGLTAETSQNNADLVIIYDDSASALRKMTVGNLLSNAGAFNNFTLSADAGSDQTISDGNTLEIAGGSGVTTTAGATDTVTVAVDSTVITGQGTYSGSVDTTNDFVLIYDNSTTSLKKIAVSDLNSASGAGTMSSFTIAGDSGSNQVVADANTLTLTGGSGIDTSVGGTDEVTIALNTEAVQDIVGAMVDGGTETNINVTYDDTNGKINFVSTDTNTQLTQEQVEDFAANVIVAGANITKTYDDAAGTLTIAATGGASNAFSTLAVSGQSNVVADATTDTLTLVAGTGMTLTTDASADSITFTSSGGSAGSMPVTLAGGTADPINLSSISTIGAIPFTGFDGSTDNIDLTGTSQTLTSFADNDGDTKLEVERSTDNDTVHIKAGGTDVLTATSSGVTISNLTVTGTSTQANEMKITDTLIELNADGTSLGVDAGIVIERGNTGADAAFIWDESSDSFAVGTLSTDGAILFDKADGTSQPLPISSGEVAFNHADGTADNLPITSSSLAFTEADGTSDPITQVSYGPETDMSVKITDATLKAKTQTTGDNSTAVATTAFVQASLGGISSDSVTDADNDTKIEVENSDADEIVMTTASQERLKVDNNVSMSARGGFFTHNLAMHASETFTIAATEGTVAAGPLDIQGTVDVQGSLVVL